MEGVQDNMAAELSRATRQARAESDRELEHKQARISALSRDNDKLHNEVSRLASLRYSVRERNSLIIIIIIMII